MTGGAGGVKPPAAPTAGLPAQAADGRRVRPLRLPCSCILGRDEQVLADPGGGLGGTARAADASACDRSNAARQERVSSVSSGSPRRTARSVATARSSGSRGRSSRREPVAAMASRSSGAGAWPSGSVAWPTRESTGSCSWAPISCRRRCRASCRSAPTRRGAARPERAASRRPAARRRSSWHRVGWSIARRTCWPSCYGRPCKGLVALPITKPHFSWSDPCGAEPPHG